MSYELTGKLIAAFDTVQRTETFKVREFAVEKTDEINGRTISNFVKFQCVQDKTTILDKYSVGDEIKVFFNIKGTKWEKDGKTNYFTNLDAWKIEPAKKMSGDQGSFSDKQYEEPMNSFSSNTPENIDDLPF